MAEHRPAGLFAARADLTTALYEPAHPSPGREGWRGGSGRNHVTWIAGSPDGHTIAGTPAAVHAILDSSLEPGASVGWHAHTDTDEIYYLLEGTLTVEATDPSGVTWVSTLGPGDAHRLGVGGSHTAQAGNAGARFVCVVTHPVTVRPNVS